MYIGCRVWSNYSAGMFGHGLPATTPMLPVFWHFNMCSQEATGAAGSIARYVWPTRVLSLVFGTSASAAALSSPQTADSSGFDWI